MHHGPLSHGRTGRESAGRAARRRLFSRPLVSRPPAPGAVSLAVLMLALAGGGAAQAGGFGIREQSAYYMGTAFAGNAAGGDGLASMAWNPAALSFTPGLSVEANATYIAPHASIDVWDVTGPVFGNDLGNLGVGDMVDNGVAPASYINYAWDRVAIGIAVTAPFGLITDATCNWSGRYYGCYSRIFDTNLEGMVAFKLADWVTLGAGVNLNYIDARLTNAQVLGVVPLPVPPYGAVIPGDAALDGDDFGVGFNLGALFTLMPGTTLGVGYRSFIDHTLGGNINITYAGLPKANMPASAALTLPDQVTASLRSQIAPDWTVMGTVEWTNWSTVQNLTITSNGSVASIIDMRWTDGWYFSGGAEYRWAPNLALRAGIGYELTPVPDETRLPRLPDTNRLWLSGGFTYDFTPQLALDFAYTHIWGETSPMELLASDTGNALRGSLIGEVNDGYVDIVSVGLRYKFDTPVVGALVTK